MHQKAVACESDTGFARLSADVAQDIRQPRILLLDDDPFALGLITQSLSKMGYRDVRPMSSAESALALLTRESGSVDLILCDLHMPGMDGVEFLQHLRRSDFCGSVALLSVESLRLMNCVQRLLSDSRMTVLGGLRKPADPAAIRSLLGRWQASIQPSRSAVQVAVMADELITAAQDKQLRLEYQPKVHLRTGEVLGFEALVRWQHPRLGLLSPDQFIPLAEASGAIDGLTLWVLNEGLLQLSQWRLQGQPLELAINVALPSLHSKPFVQQLITTVRNSIVTASDLTLEVTETGMRCQGKSILENLLRLRLERFHLSIDDFGTGHATLAQLRDIPFTELKIDRSFVTGARTDPFIRPMLEGSIDIARRLDMQSVAEGVETEDDWHLLRSLNCDVAQGYLIGRPMPAELLPVWRESWEQRALWRSLR